MKDQIKKRLIMAKKKTKTRAVYRSAISGKFVSKKYTKRKPRVTFKQKVRMSK